MSGLRVFRLVIEPDDSACFVREPGQMFSPPGWLVKWAVLGRASRTRLGWFYKRPRRNICCGGGH